jgi:hypothetical protein
MVIENRSIRTVSMSASCLRTSLFEIAATRAGSGIVLVSEKDLENANQPSPGGYGVEAESCSWWSRGRLELHLEHEMMVLLAA